MTGVPDNPDKPIPGAEPQPDAPKADAPKADAPKVKPEKSEYDSAQEADDARDKNAAAQSEPKASDNVNQDAKVDIQIGAGADARKAQFVANQQINQQINQHIDARRTVKRNPKDVPIRDPIDPTEPEKLEAVFVEPKSFEEQKGKLKAATEKPDSANRIIIVHGKESTGRYAVALRLGSLLLGKKPTELVWFRPVASQSRTVKEVVESINPKPGGVYIIRDAFGPDGLNAEQFRNWHEANKLLRGSWLLLTATTEAASTLPQDLERIESGEVDLAVAVAKHVAWYESGSARGAPGTATTGRLPAVVAKQVRDDLTKLAQALGAGVSGNSPVKADLFCRRILTDTAVRDALTEPINTSRLQNAIASVARQIAAGDSEAAARWFKGLNRNAQLFALLLGLFSGVRRSLLELLYEEVVYYLRHDEKLEYDDPREYGFNDLYRDLNVRPDKMEFADPAFAEHVEGQTQNYAHLLMSLLDVVLHAVRVFGERDHWELRLRIGQFAGRYGVPQFDRLRKLMDGLAEDRSGRVSIIAGHAAAELALRTTQHDQPLLTQLTTWIDSEDGDRVWTAGVALQRLYPVWFADPDRNIVLLRQLFTRLAERSDEVEGDSYQGRLIREEQDLLKRRLGYEKTNWGDLEDRESLNEVVRDLVADRMTAASNDCARGVGIAVADGLFSADPKGTVIVLREWLAPDPPAKHPDEEELESADTEAKKEAEKDDAKNPTASKPTDSAASTGAKPGTRTPADSPATIAKRRETRRWRGAEAVRQLFDETRTKDGEYDALTDNHAVLLELLPDILAVELEPPDEETPDSEHSQTDTILRTDEVDVVEHKLIEPVFRVLAGWLARPEWRQRVALALLKTINRSKTVQRQRLRRGLLETWLKDDHDPSSLPPAARAIVQQYAEALLLRERLLEGAVCDFPGGGRGLLFVDASREGRHNGSAIDLVGKTYHRLRAQTDLTIGWLGTTQLLTPTGAQVTPDLLRPTHHHPRLLLPALTPENFAAKRKGGKPFTIDDVHFALVPHWGSLEDGDDLLEPRPGEPPNPTWEVWRHRLLKAPVSGAREAVEELRDEYDELSPDYLARVRKRDPELADFLEEEKHHIGVEAIRAIRENYRMIEKLFEFWLHPLVETALARRLSQRTKERWRELMATTPGLPAVPANEPTAIASFVASAVEFLKSGSGDLDEITSTEPPDAKTDTRAPDRVRTMLCVLQGVAAHDHKAAVDVVAGWLQAKDERENTLGIAAARSLLRVFVETRMTLNGRWIGAIDLNDPVFEVFRLAPGLAEHERDPRLGLSLLLLAARSLAENVAAAKRMYREPSGLGAAAQRAARYKPDLLAWFQKRLQSWNLPLRTPAPKPVDAVGRPAKAIFDPFGREAAKAASAAVPKPVILPPVLSTEGAVFLADRLGRHLRPPAPAITPNRHYGVLLLQATSGLYDTFAKELQKVLVPALPEDIQLLVFRVGTMRPVATGRKAAPMLPVAPENVAPALIGPILEQPDLYARVRFAVLLTTELPMDFEEAQHALDELPLVSIPGREPFANERSRYATGFIVREKDDKGARASGWELVLRPNLANSVKAPREAASFAERFLFPVTGRRSNP